MGVEHLIGEGSSRPAQPSPSIYSGKILDTAVLLTDTVRVTIEEIDNEFQTHGPCRWMPRGEVFPSAGDPCVVVIDEQLQPWVSVWYPAE